MVIKMKKTILLFILSSNFLASETFWFEFVDPMHRHVLIEQLKDPFDETLETLVKVKNYNSPVFLVERLDFNYTTKKGSVSLWDRRVKGNVELLNNHMEFIPDDVIYIEEQIISSIYFLFYGQCFKYYLILDPDVIQVENITIFKELSELDDLGKYIYVVKDYEYEGIYN